MPEIDVARMPGRDFPDGEVIYDSDKHGWGGWRDHTEQDSGTPIVRGALGFEDWPGPYGPSMLMSTGSAASATARHDNSSSAYLNLSRYFSDVAAQAGGKTRWLRIVVKFSVRVPDETKDGWALTFGVDTQAPDNSWRGFPKIQLDFGGNPTHTKRWVGIRGSNSTFTAGGLQNAPIVGNNELKGNEGQIEFYIDLWAVDGKGRLSHAIINGAYCDLTGIGEAEYGAQEVQVASPFAHGQNIGIYLTNSADAATAQPIRANIHRVKVEIA